LQMSTDNQPSGNDPSNIVPFHIYNNIKYYIRNAKNEDSMPLLRQIIVPILHHYKVLPDDQFAQFDSSDSDMLDIEANYFRRGGCFEVIFTKVEEGKEVLVGSMGIYPHHDTACELRKMYLHENARAIGLGSKLLQRALEKAKKMGFEKMELETASPLKEAIALYKKFGFRQVTCSKRLQGCAGRCDQLWEIDL
jgi:putative acetyltransferase